jgi:hypothetical protein
LVSHIESRPFTAYEDLIVFHLYCSVISGRQDKAASLAVHGFGS